MLPRARFLLLTIAMTGITHTHAAAADSPKTVHLVSRIVGKEFLSETVRVGDLNGDGAPDRLFVQNLYGPRIITALAASTITGEILWQKGT